MMLTSWAGGLPRISKGILACFENVLPAPKEGTHNKRKEMGQGGRRLILRSRSQADYSAATSVVLAAFMKPAAATKTQDSSIATPATMVT